MALDPQQILLIGIPPSAISASTSKFFHRSHAGFFKLVAWNAESVVTETEEKPTTIPKLLSSIYLPKIQAAILGKNPADPQLG
jgi:hypothetical protein